MDKLNLYHELEQLLRMNSRYCMDDGRLLKNQIVEDALSIQPLLVKELLGNEKMKKVFFTDVEGVMVFDKILNFWAAAIRCSKTKSVWLMKMAAL